MNIVIIVVATYVFGLINNLFNRRSMISSVFFLITLIIIMGGNNLNQDYLNYSYLYDGINVDYAGYGYQLLMSVGHTINLNYDQFRLFVCSISLILMWIGFQRMLSALSYKVYLFYFIYPFFIDVIQLRNFIVMSLLIFATSFFKKNNIFSELLFILFILVGAAIQTLSLIYLLAVLIYRFDSDDKIKELILIVMLILTILSTLPFVQNFLSNLILNSSIGLLQRASTYSVKVVRHGFYLYWLSDYLLVGCFIYLRKYSLIDTKSNAYKIETAIYSIMTVASLLFPFYTIDLSFHRAFRNVIPLIIVGEIIFFSKKNGNSRVKYVVMFVSIMAIGILFMNDTLSLFGVSYDPFYANWLLQ